jgi:hypothetical protein
MNSCIRCGIKLSHNYLKGISMPINEKVRRVLVCSMCEGILGAKAKNPPGGQSAKGDMK